MLMLSLSTCTAAQQQQCHFRVISSVCNYRASFIICPQLYGIDVHAGYRRMRNTVAILLQKEAAGVSQMYLGHRM